MKLLDEHKRHCHIHQIRKHTVDLEEILNPVDEFASVASPPMDVETPAITTSHSIAHQLYI